MSRSRSVAFTARPARVLGGVTAALMVVAATACSTQATGSAAALVQADGTSQVSATSQVSTDQASVTVQADVQAIAQTSITWGACPALAPGSTRNPKEKCGTVSVPLDYSDPTGKKITVEVSELATCSSKKRTPSSSSPGSAAATVSASSAGGRRSRRPAWNAS